MICLEKEKLILIKEVPAWCMETIGKRVSLSTIYRWYLKGIRGQKLDTILIGGHRYTSRQKLSQFFIRSTESAESGTATASDPDVDIDSVNSANQSLSDDGM